MKVLINTGIRTVYYDRPYKLKTVGELLSSAKIRLVQVTLPKEGNGDAA
jgi:dCMP deaminase